MSFVERFIIVRPYLGESTIRGSTVQWNPSNADTLGPESTVLIIEVSSFQGLEMYCGLL